MRAFVSGTSATVLVTGFGPYPGAPFNPTATLVRQLGRSRRAFIGGIHVVPHVFETRYAAVDAALPRLLAEHQPDAVIMFGLATRARWLRVETGARNMRSRLLPDVAGEAATTARIRHGAPPFLRGRAPFSSLLALTRRAGVPARLSHDAGRYLCNYAYWRLLERDADALPAVAVFIHVPLVPRGPVPARPGRRRAIGLGTLLTVAEAMVATLGASARREGLDRPASAQPARPGS